MVSEIPELPKYHHRSSHELMIEAGPEAVWTHVRNLDFTVSPVVRALFLLRGMRRIQATRDLERLGFTILREEPPDYLLLGLIGQFWRVGGNLKHLDKAEFTNFDEAGYAKAVWSFELQPTAGGMTRLVTQTLVFCTDEASRRSFNRYWQFIGPFSGLIRREILRAIRKQVES